MAMKSNIHDLNVLPGECIGMIGSSDYVEPNSGGLHNRTLHVCNADSSLLRNQGTSSNFSYNNRAEERITPELRSLPMRLHNPLFRNNGTLTLESSRAKLKMTKSCTKLEDMQKFILNDKVEGRSTPKRSGSNLMLRNLLTATQKSRYQTKSRSRSPIPSSTSGLTKNMQNYSSSVDTEGKAAPKRISSNLLLRSLLTPNQKGRSDTKSGSFPTAPTSCQLKMSKSSSKLQDMQTLITSDNRERTYQPNQSGPSTSSQNPLDESERFERSSSTAGLLRMTKPCIKAEDTHNFRRLEGRSSPKRTGSSVLLQNLFLQQKGQGLSEGQSGTIPIVSTGGNLKKTKSYGKMEDMKNFSSSDNATPKRTGSSLLLRNPIPRNGRSGTFQIGPTSGQLTITRSCAKLDEMRNYAISKTSSCGRNLSSQALQALSKISNKQLDSEQDPVFFSMIEYNPMDSEERAKYDDLAVKKYIRRHPEALRVEYDFKVGGRGRLTVSRYPLSALVALGASLAVVKYAIKINPSALEATKDFHSTALHTACSFNTDMEVVRYIYNKYPAAITETTKLVYLPLHNACQASSQENPMFDIIQFLVEEYPEGLMAINKLGDTPLRMAQRKGTMPKEVLEFVEATTQRIFSLEENSETLDYVSERQSWGSTSTSRELSEELVERVILSVNDDLEAINGQPRTFAVTAL